MLLQNRALFPAFAGSLCSKEKKTTGLSERDINQTWYKKLVAALRKPGSQVEASRGLGLPTGTPAAQSAELSTKGTRAALVQNDREFQDGASRALNEGWALLSTGPSLCDRSPTREAGSAP